MIVEINIDDNGKSSFELYPKSINDSIYLQHQGIRPKFSFAAMRAEREIDEMCNYYDIDEHKHNFAVWAASNAVKRAKLRFTTAQIKQAIESIELRNIIDDKLQSLDYEILSEMGYDEDKLVLLENNYFDFDKFHTDIVKKLMNKLNITTYYGLAAKILAVYLKVYAVIPYPFFPFAQQCHPPIDSILLKNLRKQGVDIKYNIRWSTMDEDTYWNVINKIRERFSKLINAYGFWIIEFLWTPTKK